MSGPAPEVAAIRSAVRARLAELPAGRVLVACSGGPDSLVLAVSTAFEARRSGHLTGAVIVDHGLQPGSAAVAQQTAQDLADRGLNPVEVIDVEVEAQGEGLEAAARQARYRALGEAAARQSAVAVLLGHTLDDQAEQVLLGLARGSGARSLAGMPATRPVPGVAGAVFVRPLLGVPRRSVHAAVEALGLTPWQDPTNRDPAFTRARVRTSLLPALEQALGPGVREALARTADQLREDADLLDELADARYVELAGQPAATADATYAATDAATTDSTTDDATTDAGEGMAQDLPLDEAGQGLPVDGLVTLPDALRRRVLLRWLRDIGCPAGSLSRGQILATDALVTAWRGQGPVHLPGGRQVQRRSGKITQVRRSPR